MHIALGGLPRGSVPRWHGTRWGADDADFRAKTRGLDDKRKALGFFNNNGSQPNKQQLGIAGLEDSRTFAGKFRVIRA